MPQPNNQHVLLDFNQLTENGLKPLVKAINSAGANVVKVIPAGTSRKKDGIAIKTFSLVAEDEQVMQVQVNDTGDISGVLINGKNAPFQHTDNLAQVGQQLSKIFTTGATAFEKALARKLTRQAAKAAGGTAGGKNQPAVRSNAQLYADAKTKRDQAKADISKAQAEMEEVQKSVNGNNSQISALTQSLATEKSQGQQLQAEIDHLSGGKNA